MWNLPCAAFKAIWRRVNQSSPLPLSTASFSNRIILINVLCIILLAICLLSSSMTRISYLNLRSLTYLLSTYWPKTHKCLPIGQWLYGKNEQRLYLHVSGHTMSLRGYTHKVAFVCLHRCNSPQVIPSFCGTPLIKYQPTLMQKLLFQVNFTMKVSITSKREEYVICILTMTNHEFSNSKVIMNTCT